MNDNLEESADLTQKTNSDLIVDEAENLHEAESVSTDVPEAEAASPALPDPILADPPLNDSVDRVQQNENDLEQKTGDDEPVSPSEAVAPAPPTVSAENKEPIAKKDWYILKVQVNREDSIKRRLEERVRQTGLEKHIEQILVPTEKVTTVKNGKKRVVKRKLYPGYLVVNMEINDDTWYLVRETAGIGDFTGAAGKPVPMLAHEVQRILQAESGDTQEAPKLKIPYEVGDMVKINDGTFKEIEGEVSTIDEVTGRVTVIITIFARSTPVELEYWQIEKAG